MKINFSTNKKVLEKGFTLMEMLIVIGVLALISVVPMFMNIDSYRGEAFRGEQNTLGILLQTARANAFNNINQKKHGVVINPSGYEGYVVFEGNTYATADHSKDSRTPASYKVTFSPSSPTEIVFDQLSGDANYEGEIQMTDTERNLVANIKINHEGRISW